MDVTGHTIIRLTWAGLRGPLLFGALLVVVLLTVMLSPCEHGLCDRPEPVASSTAHSAPLDPLSPSDRMPHCGLHCGGYLIIPLLIALGAPVLATRVPLFAPALRPRLLAPPLLPPPQLA